MKYKHLLSPMNIGTITIKNRTVMTATEMGMGQPDGTPTERLISYYEERAKGGTGLIFPGICRVNDKFATTTFSQLAMSHDSQIEPMREFAMRIHKHGAKLGIQLHHPGRQGYCSTVNVLPALLPVAKKIPAAITAVYKMAPHLMKLEEKGICLCVEAPSACERSYHVPSRILPMSNRQVKSVIQDFIDAAVRCQKAGVDVVELHSAHGYLLQQFLSPNTNHRKDEYGGSFDNRMRFITEIIQGIREKCGSDYPLIVRLSVDEMYEQIGKPGKGYTLEEGKRIAKRLEELGVDAINVTSACYDTYNYWLEPTTFEPGWRSYLAKEIKSVVKIPVIAASFIRSPEQAEALLAEDNQDFIGSGRNFICDPEWIKKTEEDRTDEIKRCIGCLHCIRSMTYNCGYNLIDGKSGECAVNPEVGYEWKNFIGERDGNDRRVVIIGAGVSGLKAAELLAMRGFKVDVIEKEDEAGGQINLASSCTKRDKLFWCITDLLTNVRKLGVNIMFNTEASVDIIKKMEPYAVIIATGGTAVVPRAIKGIELPIVCTSTDIITGKKEITGKNTIVIGSGMTGLETAELLGEKGNKVDVIEMAPEIAPGAWFQLVDDELMRLEEYNVSFHTGKRLMKVTPDSIIVEDVKSSHMTEFPADCVVLAMGVRPANQLYNELYKNTKNVYIIGDASSSGTIANATRSAFDIANAIH